MTTRWTHKDLLGLRELTADEINFVLETTDAFKQVGTREIKKVPALRGKTLVNFFVEPSTRTRTSFRAGCISPERRRDQYLGNDFEPDERRNAQGHRAQSRGACRPTLSCCATAPPAHRSFWQAD